MGRDVTGGRSGDRSAWLERVGSITQWQRRGERAPHKPLLLLFRLGRLQATGSSRVRYAEVESDLRALLDEFGPTRASKPEYPFHHLQSDGPRHVDGDDGSAPTISRTPCAGDRCTTPSLGCRVRSTDT